MKKTYIEPNIIAVVLNVRDNVLQGSLRLDKSNKTQATEGNLSRETITPQDAWEEW